MLNAKFLFVSVKDTSINYKLCLYLLNKKKSMASSGLNAKCFTDAQPFFFHIVLCQPLVLNLARVSGIFVSPDAISAIYNLKNTEHSTVCFSVKSSVETLMTDKKKKNDDV